MTSSVFPPLPPGREMWEKGGSEKKEISEKALLKIVKGPVSSNIFSISSFPFFSKKYLPPVFLSMPSSYSTSIRSSKEKAKVYKKS